MTPRFRSSLLHPGLDEPHPSLRAGWQASAARGTSENNPAAASSDRWPPIDSAQGDGGQRSWKLAHHQPGPSTKPISDKKYDQLKVYIDVGPAIAAEGWLLPDKPGERQAVENLLVPSQR